MFYLMDDVFHTFSNIVSRNNLTSTHSGERNGNVVEIPMNDLSYWVNGSRSSSAPELLPFVHDGEVYVYMDIVVRGLGLSLRWDGAARMMFIENR